MKNKKSIIEKVVFATIIVFIVVFGGIVINKKESQIRNLDSDTQTLQTVIEGRDSLLNEFFASFNEIENNLTYIKQKRNQLELEKAEGNISQKESIIEDIRLLDSLLANNDQKIKKLENKLYKSNIKLSEFDKKIAELSQNIEQQDSEMYKLKSILEEKEVQIVQLNTEVEDLKSEIVAKEESIIQQSEIIKEKEDEMNTAHLAFGTFKELKENNVVTKEGGILGIGGEKTAHGNINEEYFLDIDIRETCEIPLYSKKVKFISEHPDSSYSFKMDEGLITHLEIEDPKEFWKMSKYAIIETKY